MFDDRDHNMKMELFLLMTAMIGFIIGFVIRRGY